jgi:hypothetical protein
MGTNHWLVSGTMTVVFKVVVICRLKFNRYWCKRPYKLHYLPLLFTQKYNLKQIPSLLEDKKKCDLMIYSENSRIPNSDRCRGSLQ